MERLVETVAAYLCRHRSVGLLRLTLDLTRRRLDFAEIGAAEVVKGAATPPTPGTDTRWRAVAAVREAVVARERACPVREGGGSGQLDGSALLTNRPHKTANCEERRAFPPFSRFSFRGVPKNGVSILPNAM